MPQKRRKIIGTTGDVNAIDYGGGVVFDQGYGPEWTFWDEPETEDAEYMVYTANVADDVFEDHRFADEYKIGTHSDINPLKLRALGRSKNVMERVEALAMIAAYYGAHEIAGEAQQYTHAEMNRTFGPTFRAKRRR